MKTFVLTVILLCTTFTGVAALCLPSNISDNMVIQRDCPIKLWGWAAQGETITATINGQLARTKAGKNGVWEVTLPAMNYGGPYELVITGKTEKQTFTNVLIGDIWVCSGQSNMEWPVANSLSAPEEIGNARYPHIRLLTVHKEVSNTPRDEVKTDGWRECNPQYIADFSAVGYFFGRELHTTLDIPIGLINSTCGATNIETWTSASTMYTLDEYKSRIDAMHSEEVNQRIRNGAIYPNEYPALLFNSMIAPLTQFPVKGVIWYQGESNIHNTHLYTTLLVNLINDWRNAWQLSDLPFYYVQLPNFLPISEGNSEGSWVKVREAQHKARLLHYTGEVVTIDIGEPLNIHPLNKQEVGRRLALQALSGTYGYDILCSGPEYVSMEIRNDSIILTFENTGKGLYAGNKHTCLKGFAIAGSGREFKPAKAYPKDNKVFVYSSEVHSPVAVRYAWEDNPENANLYNSAGLPASPFRTDHW